MPEGRALRISYIIFAGVKRRINPGLGFFSFKTARRTIGGFETMNMIRKGQVEGIGKGDIRGQVKFVESLFEVAA
jgi:transposase, IS6 family